MKVVESEDCVDVFTDFCKEYMLDDNLSPKQYYEIQNLVCGFGLPFQMIDVCIDSCMIYWNTDKSVGLSNFL